MSHTCSCLLFTNQQHHIGHIGQWASTNANHAVTDNGYRGQTVQYAQNLGEWNNTALLRGFGRVLGSLVPFWGRVLKINYLLIVRLRLFAFAFPFFLKSMKECSGGYSMWYHGILKSEIAMKIQLSPQTSKGITRNIKGELGSWVELRECASVNRVKRDRWRLQIPTMGFNRHLLHICPYTCEHTHMYTKHVYVCKKWKRILLWEYPSSKSQKPWISWCLKKTIQKKSPTKKSAG